LDINRIVGGSRYPLALTIAISAIGFFAVCWNWFTPSSPSSTPQTGLPGNELSDADHNTEYNQSSSSNSVTTRNAFDGTILALSEYSASVAERVRPGLTKIYVSRSVKNSNDKEIESYFGQIPIEKNTDVGSGFFIRPDGFIVTDYHVVKSYDSIRIEDGIGGSWTAKLHGHDAVSDVAVLKVETKNHPHLEWGDSKKLRSGNFVWVAGSPFGLESSLSFGIVSSTGRNLMNGSALRDYFQTDAAINPGSSGGPMVDVDGRVVGIASAILGEDYRGIGFALPEYVASPITKQLIETGKVVRGWIGAQLGQITPDRARKSGLDGIRGAYIEWLEPGEDNKVPAKNAGLLAGDICTRCNGVSIESHYDLARQIAFTTPGELLNLDVRRSSKSLKLVVRVAERP
jgi:S1-C subfamily serine protease